MTNVRCPRCNLLVVKTDADGTVECKCPRCLLKFTKVVYRKAISKGGV